MRLLPGCTLDRCPLHCSQGEWVLGLAWGPSAAANPLASGVHTRWAEGAARTDATTSSAAQSTCRGSSLAASP